MVVTGELKPHCCCSNTRPTLQQTQLRGWLLMRFHQLRKKILKSFAAVASCYYSTAICSKHVSYRHQFIDVLLFTAYTLVFAIHLRSYRQFVCYTCCVLVPVSIHRCLQGKSCASQLVATLQSRWLIWLLRHDKPVVELARALLSFKWPTRRRRTATVPIILNFHLGRQGYAKCCFFQCSKPNKLVFNTMFYNSVCLKGQYGPYW